MQFIDERIEGDISIWEPLKKTKLPTFAANIKSHKMTLNNNVIKIKEERKLMSRPIVAARSRPEIDLSNYFGEFEFSVVPKSLFSADGNLLKTSDKSVIVQEIEKQYPDINITSFREDSDSVLIFDGMAIANRISIQKCQLKTCNEFANKFIDIILKESKLFSEVRVIFDRYDEKSLKSKTRATRTSGIQIQYKIDDNTNIEHTSTSKFLSHIFTKRDLTRYLSDKLATALSNARKRYVLVHNNIAMSNISDFPDDLRTHSHEEADTLIILHAIDVAKKNPFTQLHISCSDTDVFLLLLNYYQLICNSTVFRTKTRDIDVGSTYNNLGEEKCAALLGFHSFTGCDQTGKFSGFSKLSCWKTFVKSKPSVLEAFAELGQENVDITNSSKIGKGLIDFVLDLYHHNRPAHVNNLQSLRWYLFSKFQLESFPCNMP